jgi:plastocyanin
MRPHKWQLLLVLIFGAALAVLPAIASSETTPTVNAVVAGSEGIYTKFAWSPAEVPIVAGGAVQFSTGSTTQPHGIVWKSGPSTPSCATGVPVGEGHFATGWSGSCTFAQAGTYRYYCSYHGESMSGTITVSAAGTTTTSTGSTTATGTTPTTTTPTPVAPTPTSGGRLTRAQKLKKALRACRRQPKGRRRACIRRAHRKFGPKTR